MIAFKYFSLQMCGGPLWGDLTAQAHSISAHQGMHADEYDAKAHIGTSLRRLKMQLDFLIKSSLSQPPPSPSAQHVNQSGVSSSSRWLAPSAVGVVNEESTKVFAQFITEIFLRALPQSILHFPRQQLIACDMRRLLVELGAHPVGGDIVDGDRNAVNAGGSKGGNSCASQGLRDILIRACQRTTKVQISDGKSDIVGVEKGTGAESIHRLVLSPVFIDLLGQHCNFLV